MESNQVRARIAEFERNVWNHSEDEFQVEFDRRDPLTDRELQALRELIDGSRLLDEAELSSAIRRQILTLGEDYFFLLLQLCGLTRSKILSDLRAAASSNPSMVRMPSSHWAIASSDKAWTHAGSYLVARLTPILVHLATYQAPESALEAISQATWPGYIRQERAKRQGHEAEGRLARLLRGCGIPFAPEQKADNPMCPDATINGVSFDIVIPSISSVGACFKSTVHTSNIGQYGESKDHLEVDEARRMLDSRFASGSRPTLVALIDGVGFQSNRAGLEGVLSKSDEFCQFKTLWKALLIGGAICGRKIDLWLPHEVTLEHSEFIHRWRRGAGEVHDLALHAPPSTAVKAGGGWASRPKAT
ncbi:MAG: hypothetical protein U0133_22275 [Gemmatimonadales bacterium]